LREATNPVAQAFFTIFDNSPETLFATLLMALYPILEHLPFSWIKRSEDAKTTVTNAARELIELNKRGGGAEKDILGCMVKENRRLEHIGGEGLSDEEMIYQILTFLAAGYKSLLPFPLLH
jgi:cytochrome P450